MRGVLFGLAAGLLLVSCSSAPKAPDQTTEKKNRAAEYTEAGNAYFSEGRYRQALQFFNLALNDNISVDNEEGIARSYNSIGKVYLAAGYLEEADQQFRRARAQAEKLGDPLLIAQSKNNLAEAYLERGQLEEAEVLLEEATAAIEGQEAAAELAIIYHNLGSVYKKRGMLQEAIRYFSRALELNTGLKRYAEMASNHYMIASIHSKREDYAAARASIDLALGLDKRVENSIGIGKDLLARGIIEEKAGNNELAYESYEKSLQVYQAMHLYRAAAGVLPYLINLAERLGKEEEALRYRDLQKQFQGS